MELFPGNFSVWPASDLEDYGLDGSANVPRKGVPVNSGEFRCGGGRLDEWRVDSLPGA